MDDDRTPGFRGERELRGERAALELARRVVVVIVEAALADRDRAPSDSSCANRRGIADGIERRRVVRVDAGREVHEARDATAEIVPRPRGGGERLTDGDDRGGARRAGAGDHSVAIGVERGIGEVSVRVEKTHSTDPVDALPRDRRGYAYLVPDRFRGLDRPDRRPRSFRAWPPCVVFAVFTRGYFVSIQSRIGDAT